MPKKPPARRAKRAPTQSRTITDLPDLLQRHRPAGKDGRPISPTAWAVGAGVESAFREFNRGRNPDKSMVLQNLDKLAVYAGCDDFVHMASGTPRFDRALFRRVVTAAFRARDLHDDLAPETWARLLLLMFERASREPGRWDAAQLTDDLELLLESAAEDA
jgi:hypothetical protein